MEVKPLIVVCPETGNPVEKSLNDAVIVGEVGPMAQTETKTDGGVGGIQALDCKADATCMVALEISSKIAGDLPVF
ncbi:hypothetical protein KIN20_031558 [Parelaphostrongylus tenuis]|uniref:Uncharacterized protein n=1 Tax=Parelaphostrongylus tenuis TaxID=148309 RepID=A0AAD5R6X9_PARTN|nr:hypothetical protein KIN20_031558 [Parelaphostrongylus tenuis]